MNKLPRRFYNRDTIIVAKELLGKYLVHHYNGVKQVGRIVEVEAYLGPHDLAAHSSKGKTKRTEVMFGPPGFAYVYMIYGMYFCMNVVTQEEGLASAVLIRAVEPIQHITDKTKGPGLLCKAMQIDKKLQGADLLGDSLYITHPPEDSRIVSVKKARIGVHYAKHWAKRLLRFYIKNNEFISKL
jgi:DNA-3-methyladenine glycosylase